MYYYMCNFQFRDNLIHNRSIDLDRQYYADLRFIVEVL